MFKAGATNPYDEIVVKTTDENLTGENWELILNLCDKVQDEGETGARNVIAAILKRLTHRSANVQLYTLTLAESLSKNCGLTLHRELASKAFTAGLEKLIMDRTTHDKVRNRALGLIEEWKHEFESNPELGIMEECHTNLKSKSFKFDAPNEPPPREVDDEVRRKEEEELQRVLELSVQDKGGKSKWSDYTLTSAGAAAQNQGQSSSQPYRAPPVESGYVPASAVPPQVHVQTNTPAVQQPSKELVSPVNPAPAVLVTRVRALHSFEPTEAGELAFERGDVIKVVDRGYKDWWRGQLRGRTGIFPVNYVEPLPEPTPAELAREAEQEAAVFSKAADVDKLLTMLKDIDPARDNLADNEEIQELYRSCMIIRPKIVKLIDRYSQKRADLVTMNETFVKARSIFDQMMEESLARNSQAYDRPIYGHQPPIPQGFGWGQPGYDQPGYNAYPQQPPHQPPQPGYSSELYNGQPVNIYPQQQPGGQYQQQPPQQGPSPQPAPYGTQPQPLGAPPGPDPSGLQYQQPQQYPGYGGPQSPGTQLPPIQPLSLGSQGRPPTAQAGFNPPQQQQQPMQAQPQPQPQVQPQPQQQVQPQPIQPQPQTQPQPPIQPQPQVQPQPQAQPQPQVQPQPQSQASQPELQRRPTLPAQFQSQQQIQPQPVAQEPQPQPQQQQPQPQPQSQSQTEPQPQAQATPVQNTQTGPPYTYEPSMRYADSNVQAWAQYYAQGGKDPTGAVYFISVPGVKEPAPPEPTPPQPIAAATTTAATTTAANPNPNPNPNLGQSLARRESLLHNPHGTAGTNGGGQTEEDDLPLQNPYDRYGIGGTDQTPGPGGAAGPGYGASPYYGLTRDVAGMGIKG